MFWIYEPLLQINVSPQFVLLCQPPVVIVLKNPSHCLLLHHKFPLGLVKALRDLLATISLQRETILGRLSKSLTSTRVL